MSQRKLKGKATFQFNGFLTIFTVERKRIAENYSNNQIPHIESKSLQKKLCE